MANISLRDVHKIYPGGVHAVTGFDLEIADKEFVVLVGPSGCGKSTALRMIAGLEEISSGEIYIGGELINNVPAKDRDIAMVFQSYALYPHMSVYQNMAYGLKLRKTPRDEIDERIHEAAGILQIEHLLKRKPKALSGGERQRVALGRAIVRSPSAFLFDEPLSNLDAKLRASMRAEIKKLHERLSVTFVYVTHDQTEAMTMGDRIVVMKGGVIQQADVPRVIYNKPKNTFTAGFIGSPQMNIIPGILNETDNGFAVSFGEESILLPSNKASHMNHEFDGRNVIFGIRPESLFVAGDNSECQSITAKVELSESLGSECYLHLDFAGTSITARVPADTEIFAGDMVKMGVDINKIHLFDADTEESVL